jgi:acyl-CoA thioesterase-1
MKGLLAVLLLLTLAAPAAAADRVIAVLGDSLTAGLGVSPDEAYPSRLEEKLKREGYGYRVVNAGVSGDTSSGGLRRIDFVLRLHPDVVIVALGANDGLRGQPVGQLRDNLVAIVQKARTAGARVLLAGMRVPTNYGAEYTRDFAAVFPEVARRTKVPLVPFLLEGVAADARFNQGDGIHPNADGQRVIAEHLWPHLKPLLVKSGVTTAPPRATSRVRQRTLTKSRLVSSAAINAPAITVKRRSPVPANTAKTATSARAGVASSMRIPAATTASGSTGHRDSARATSAIEV